MLTSRERRKGWLKVLSISQSSIPDVQIVVRLKGEGCPGYLWTSCTSRPDLTGLR